MKKILRHLSKFSFLVMPVTALLFCSWDSPGKYNYSNRNASVKITKTDTTPPARQDDFKKEDFEKVIKSLDENMANLDDQMKDFDINIDKEVEAALSKLNFEEIQKQTEASLKAIDWNKMQQDINVSLQNVQQEIAKIDFSKMQLDMKDLQLKFQSEEFKSQFNSEKLQKQIDGSMSKAREGIEKARQKMQQTKAFSDELAADGLIDKKKGYELEWKSGELYINGQKQSKDISDKYRRYKSSGKIKMLPEGAEHF